MVLPDAYVKQLYTVYINFNRSFFALLCTLCLVYSLTKRVVTAGLFCAFLFI